MNEKWIDGFQNVFLWSLVDQTIFCIFIYFFYVSLWTTGPIFLSGHLFVFVLAIYKSFPNLQKM